MPEPTHPPTLIHYIDHPAAEYTACTIRGTALGTITTHPGAVTCFRCRNSALFKRAQGVGAPTPLPQRRTPRLLRDIIAESQELRDIVKQGLNAGTNDAEHEALTDLADVFGLTYDEDTDTYT